MSPSDPILDALPGVVYTAGPEGYRTWSAGAQTLTGREPAELLGEGFDACVHPEDRERRTTLRSGLATSFTYRLQLPDGTLKWVRECVSAQDVDPRVGMVSDISDEVHEEARRELQARLHTVGELAAGVAHAVNNPLAGVLNYAQLAQRFEPSERLSETLDGIVAEGERILAITNELLTFTRNGELRALSASELVGATLTLAKRELRDEFIIINSEVPTGLPPMRARAREVHEALHCLLENARQALNARHPERSPDKVLTVRASAADGQVRIEVEDTGEGIPEERTESIFVAFETTRAGARGLGLTIARAIAEEHGGSLTVRCADGRTTFALSIPTVA